MDFEDLVLEFDEILEENVRKEYCVNKTQDEGRRRNCRLS